MTRQFRVPVVGRALSPVGSEFVNVEALGGTVLLVATLAAFAWANAAGASYADVWAHDLTLGWGRFAISQDLRHWVNDGLMTLFFFVVGLEIKRELVEGELRDRRTASLPVVAALGGMVVPALLYTAVNAGGAGSRGWAIPMATDIAFAVVVLAVLGSRVPNPLRLFLLTLAIVDDIGAILVIALFYSEHIAFGWLLAAAGVIASSCSSAADSDSRTRRSTSSPRSRCGCACSSRESMPRSRASRSGSSRRPGPFDGRRIIEQSRAPVAPVVGLPRDPALRARERGDSPRRDGASRRGDEPDHLGHHPRPGRRQAARDRRCDVLRRAASARASPRRPVDAKRPGRRLRRRASDSRCRSSSPTSPFTAHNCATRKSAFWRLRS